MGGVEYQVTKVDPTNPETKGMVYQVHKVSEEVAATLGGKVYRARIIKDPTEPTVAGKVYQIVLIDDPDDPAVKGKVYNAILTGGSEVVVVGPAVSPLSLPDAIADSLSYVKAFGGTEQRNLPSGYTQLEYIQSDGASYLIVPYRVNNKTVFYCRYNEIQNGPQTANAIFGVTDQPHVSIAYNGILRLTGVSFDRMGWGDNTSGSIIDVGAPKAFDTWYEVLYDQNELYQDGILYATSATDPSTVWSANYDLGIFARNSSSVTMFAVAKISSVWVKEDGEYKINLVPAKRNSDNVLGMYDLVSGQFLTNAGTGTFVAGGEAVPAPDAPMDIVSNNGTICYSPNMYNKDYEYERIQGFFASSGTTWSYADAGYSIRIECQPNTTYTARYNGNSTQAVLGFGSTSNDNVPTSDGSVTVTQGIRQNSPTINTPITLTTGANDKWLIIAFNIAEPQHTDMMENLQLEKGSTATPYAPYSPTGIYTDGTVETIKDSLNNTATAEMLLKVGDYQDVQSIIDGAVTRNAKALVLDGVTDGKKMNPAWNSTYKRGNINLQDNAMTPVATADAYCTHFVYDASVNGNPTSSGFCTRDTDHLMLFSFLGMSDINSATDANAWLAAQYAAGTPVIVVYPLATPTTESVTGQTLQVTDGDNVLEITQASLTGLELEAEYEKEGA